jgi:hypothetical protein
MSTFTQTTLKFILISLNMQHFGGQMCKPTKKEFLILWYRPATGAFGFYHALLRGVTLCPISWLVYRLDYKM